MTVVNINSEQEMAKFAQDFAQKLTIDAAKPKVIFLNATLGAGKSTFARYFINALQDNPVDVLSPTFNLVYSYDTKVGEIFHFDLYRLKSEDELENIGFFDAIQNNICLIEWPELAKKYVRNYTEIEIKILGEEQREIIIQEVHE